MDAPTQAQGSVQPPVANWAEQEAAHSSPSFSEDFRPEVTLAPEVREVPRHIGVKRVITKRAV